MASECLGCGHEGRCLRDGCTTCCYCGALLIEHHLEDCDPDAYNGCVDDCPSLAVERTRDEHLQTAKRLAEAKTAARMRLVEVAKAWGEQRGIDIAELLFRLRTAKIDTEGTT